MSFAYCPWSVINTNVIVLASAFCLLLWSPLIGKADGAVSLDDLTRLGVWPITAFVEIPIRNAKIAASVKRLQSELLARNRSFSAYILPLDSLHVTLAAFRLTDANVEAAKRALDSAGDHFRQKIRCKGGLEISLRGFFSLMNRFLYSELDDALDSYEAVWTLHGFVTTELFKNGNYCIVQVTW